MCVYIYVFVGILLLSFKYTYDLCRGFPGSSGGKESTCNAEDPSLIPVSGRSTAEGIGYHSSVLGLPLWLSW